MPLNLGISLQMIQKTLNFQILSEQLKRHSDFSLTNQKSLNLRILLK